LTDDNRPPAPSHSASGSGKSTVAALLQRLYEPSAGSVLLDNRPLNRTDVRYLRSHVAVVSQHPALFDMTVADNIAYGRPEGIVLSDVVHAAQQAHIHDFVEALPRGYDTLLGENASLISGGQAQRLQIARALVGDPAGELLILDECTSALDPANQRAVMDTLLMVKEGRTTLIVTHKLAVMEQCDRIVVVADGVVAETCVLFRSPRSLTHSAQEADLASWLPPVCAVAPSRSCAPSRTASLRVSRRAASGRRLETVQASNEGSRGRCRMYYVDSPLGCCTLRNRITASTHTLCARLRDTYLHNTMRTKGKGRSKATSATT